MGAKDVPDPGARSLRRDTGQWGSGGIQDEEAGIYKMKRCESVWWLRRAWGIGYEQAVTRHLMGKIAGTRTVRAAGT